MNPINPKYFGVKRVDNPEKAVVHHARLVDFKNQPLLCEAFVEVHKKHPDYAARLGGLEKNLVRSIRKARTDEDRQTAIDEIGRLRQTLDELEEELKA